MELTLEASLGNSLTSWESENSDLDGWEDTELLDANEVILQSSALNVESVVEKIIHQREIRQDFRALMALNEAESITDILVLSFYLQGLGFSTCFYITDIISSYTEDIHPSLSHNSTRTMFDTTSLILQALKSWRLGNVEAKCGGYLTAKSVFETRCNPSVNISAENKIIIVDILNEFLVVDHISFEKMQLISSSDAAEHFIRDPRPMYSREDLVAYLQDENPKIGQTLFVWDTELEFLAQKKLIYVTNQNVFVRYSGDAIDSGGKEGSTIMSNELEQCEYRHGYLARLLKAGLKIENPPKRVPETKYSIHGVRMN